MARNVLTSTVGSGAQAPFTASGQTPAFNPDASDFNITLWGTFSATVALERTFDGTNWFPVTYIDGTAITWTAPLCTSWDETETGAQYRLNCTWASGSVNWRISQ